MSKKFNVADLLNDKSKEKTKEPAGNIQINQIPIEEIMPSDKKQYSTCTTNRTVTLIAAEINNIKEQTRQMVLYNSIEIGRRLVEAKQMLGHGQWGEWLKKSVAYSQSTADNLMKIFNEYGSDQISLLDNNAKSQAFGNLSYSQAVAMLSIPSEDREQFIKDNDVENMSTRELQKVIKEKQELEERLKATEKTNEKHSKNEEKLKKELKDIKDKNKEELTNREVEIENLRTHIKSINEQLAKAQSAGNNEDIEKFQEALNESENKLSDAINKIEELERKLKEKPIEVVASQETIKKIPLEVEKELQELREKVSGNNELVVKFSIYFENFGKAFELLTSALEEIQEDEVKEKYKKAVIDIIEGMAEKI